MVSRGLQSAHPPSCAERVRLRLILHAGEPSSPSAPLLHEIAREIHRCCGHSVLKAHRLAWGLTAEKAVAAFHVMCDSQGLKRRGLTKRSWLEWEAGNIPSRDYQDLLSRLFSTNPVHLGFCRDYSTYGPMSSSHRRLATMANDNTCSTWHVNLHRRHRRRPGPMVPSPSGDTDDGLFRALDARFTKLTAETVLYRLDEIEHTLLAACQRSLLLPVNDGSGDHAGRVLDNIVRVGDTTMVLKLRPDLQFDHLLRFVLQDTESPILDYPGAYFHLDAWFTNSVGRFQCVRVSLPAVLSAQLSEQIADHIANGFSAGYGWLNGKIHNALSTLGGVFERDVLQMVRDHLPARSQSDLMEPVWLVKVTDDRVTYPVDGHQVTMALEAGRNFHQLQQSPAAIASALLANSIPLGKSFSRGAISENRTVHMDLARTPYQDINEDFLVSQGAIYAHDMLLSPLIGDRRGWLLAAYPAAIKDQITPALLAAKSEIDRYLRSSATPMRRPVVRHAPHYQLLKGRNTSDVIWRTR